MSKNTRTLIVKAFCEAVKANGYKAGVYASESWFNDNLHYGLLKDNYLIWVAKYGKNTGTPCTEVKLSKVNMWQYTSKGTIPGIKGNVDLNVCYMEKEEVAPVQQIHIQLNYHVGTTYKTTASSLVVRTKPKLKNGEVIKGTRLSSLKKGTKVKNFATMRLNDEIWMYLGLDSKGREKWVCADTGSVAYIE